MASLVAIVTRIVRLESLLEPHQQAGKPAGKQRPLQLRHCSSDLPEKGFVTKG
jgi:hypothetical protein